MPARRREPTRKRFARYVKIMESGCHEWQSTISKFGYGKFWYRSADRRAHRVAWELFKGPIPKGKLVLHHCDNRRCVNVDHLYLGSHKDNVRDMVSRGRHWGRRTLSNDQVKAILDLLRSPGLSQQEIARKVGCSQITVSRIKLGQREYLKWIEGT